MDQIPALARVKSSSARVLPWIFFATLLLLAVRALAGTVSLPWDPVPSHLLVGYMVYYGPSPGYHTTQIDVGNATNFTVSDLVEGTTYHFAVSAHDGVDAGSGFSNDVSATVPYSEPVAYFSVSTTSGTAPLAMNFTSASTGVISTNAWSFGDGATSSVQDPAYVYSAAGVYAVSLTVTGPGGHDTLTLLVTTSRYRLPARLHRSILVLGYQ